MIKSLLKKYYIEVVFLVFCFVAAFYSQLYSLVGTWYVNEDYSHAFLIIPIVLWLIWKKKEQLETVQPIPSKWGIGIVIISLILYLLAGFAEIRTVASLAIILSVWGIVIYIYGFSVTRAISFPLAFLVFMIPIPAQIYSSLTLPLQLFVTKVSVAVISITGIAVVRDGNIIHIPGMTLEVVEACSGLRSMISLLMISAIFGYLTLRFKSCKSLLFLSGIPVAIVVNIFRVTVMAILTTFWSVDVLHGTLHTVLGLCVFALGFILLFAIRGILSWIEKAVVRKY